MSEQGIDRIADRPADILEVDVDAIGARRGEGSGQIVGMPVDGLIEAELLREVAQLLRPASNADDPAARDLRYLACDRTDRARRRRDDDRIARRGPADLDEAEIGGEPGMPSTPTAVDSGPSAGFTLRALAPCAMA